MHGVVPNERVTIQMIIFTEGRAAIASNNNFCMNNASGQSCST